MYLNFQMTPDILKPWHLFHTHPLSLGAAGTTTKLESATLSEIRGV